LIKTQSPGTPANPALQADGLPRCRFGLHQPNASIVRQRLALFVSVIAPVAAQGPQGPGHRLSTGGDEPLRAEHLGGGWRTEVLFDAGEERCYVSCERASVLPEVMISRSRHRHDRNALGLRRAWGRPRSQKSRKHIGSECLIWCRHLKSNLTARSERRPGPLLLGLKITPKRDFIETHDIQQRLSRAVMEYGARAERPRRMGPLSLPIWSNLPSTNAWPRSVVMTTNRRCRCSCTP